MAPYGGLRPSTLLLKQEVRGKFNARACLSLRSPPTTNSSRCRPDIGFYGPTCRHRRQFCTSLVFSCAGIFQPASPAQ
jgi:hypothetical protein